MATFKFEGVDDLIDQYKKLEKDTKNMIGRSIYNGAGVVMKSVKSAVEGIHTDDSFGTAENPVSGPSTIQKLGLIHALGIAPMRQDGTFWNVKIGFDGYNRVKTKTWPQGQPNMMVARSIESGTSWMSKQPFMRKAEQGSRARCEEVMRETIDNEIKKIIGEK
jgi:HK97 gp10 family phage protein